MTFGKRPANPSSAGRIGSVRLGIQEQIQWIVRITYREQPVSNIIECQSSRLETFRQRIKNFVHCIALCQPVIARHSVMSPAKGLIVLQIRKPTRLGAETNAVRKYPRQKQRIIANMRPD